MKLTRTKIRDVQIIEPKMFIDARGYFFESFNHHVFSKALGYDLTFVQDNQSRSMRGVLRGLHYQVEHAVQGKLVRVVEGVIFDVAVDIRPASATYGQWVSEILSAENRKQIWIPEGFAHGFLVVSAYAEVCYKTTDYWVPQNERSLRWDDPDLAIHWPLTEIGVAPLISERDQQGHFFRR
ncbi:dTDP-4-dehydrorhamnose 3,5-epimerase [Candidatus Pandoraea novymonadis]|nr:dTDP-4-dehydrorhamnose 3,5-epimerase [Candidatus Pandoraea novymonadis]